MALWVVNLTVDVVVEAETRESAHAEAEASVSFVRSVEWGSFVVREVRTEEDLPDGWDLDDKPVGRTTPIYQSMPEGST